MLAFVTCSSPQVGLPLVRLIGRASKQVSKVHCFMVQNAEVLVSFGPEASWMSYAMTSKWRPKLCQWTSYVSGPPRAALRPWQIAMHTWQLAVAPRPTATCHRLPMHAGEHRELRLPGMKSQHMKVHATRCWDNRRHCAWTNLCLGSANCSTRQYLAPVHICASFCHILNVFKILSKLVAAAGQHQTYQVIG